jgi:KaiC/GvpD/RAD55 family RecA-like ATPase
MLARRDAMAAGTSPDQLTAVLDSRPVEVAPAEDRDFRYYKPLVHAAEEYVTWAQTPGQRVYLGIPEFDRAMRGLAPQELLTILGYAHSGKTVLLTQIILNNPDRRIVLFTPDETRVLVLVKLAAIVHGVSVETMEERIAIGEQDAIDMVRSTATDHFPNLAVFDEGLGLDQMSRACGEVEEVLGRPELVIYDYIKLLPDHDDVVAAYNAIKRWGKGERVPLVVIQQSSRTKGRDGAVVDLDSGEFGGEQQSTFMLGVRRKQDQAKAQIREIEAKLRGNPKDREGLQAALEDNRDLLIRHKNTVTFNLIKNKRPPGRRVDDIDFRMDPETGKLAAMDGHLGEPRPVVRAHQAIQNVPMFDDEAPWREDPDEEPF